MFTPFLTNSSTPSNPYMAHNIIIVYTIRASLISRYTYMRNNDRREYNNNMRYLCAISYIIIIYNIYIVATACTANRVYVANKLAESVPCAIV